LQPRDLVQQGHRFTKRKTKKPGYHQQTWKLCMTLTHRGGQGETKNEKRKRRRYRRGQKQVDPDVKKFGKIPMRITWQPCGDRIQ